MEAEDASATAGTGKFMGRGGGGGESGHDFGADALIGEDFEEETVGDAAIDHVDLLDSGIESGEGGADLGDHAAGDDAFIDEPFDAGAVEGGDEGGWVGGVVHDAEDVGDVDEFGGAEFTGEGGGGDVGIDVEDVVGAFFAGDRGDDGYFLAMDGSEDLGGAEPVDGADEAEVDGLTVFAFYGRGAVAEEDVAAAEADGAAAELADGVDEVAVDDVLESIFDDGNGLSVSDSQAADEACGETFFGHGFGDGLAAAVDDDWIDAGEFHEDDVAEEALDEIRVVHGAAAEFDEEGLAAEALEPWHGLDEDTGFCDLFGKTFVRRLDHGKAGEEGLL